jgi:hypothetical protein
MGAGVVASYPLCRANKSFGAMDILHVATAQELAARVFLSFDGR